MNVQVADYSDFFNIIKQKFGKPLPRGSAYWKPLHCEWCGLEGCHKSYHKDYDEDEELREAGHPDL